MENYVKPFSEFINEEEKKYNDIRTALFDLGYTFGEVKSIEGGKSGVTIYTMIDGTELKFKRKTQRDNWTLIK